jgi:hypothetical protein
MCASGDLQGAKKVKSGSPDGPLNGQTQTISNFSAPPSPSPPLLLPPSSVGRRIFVTTQRQNLGMGGITGADKICTTNAGEAAKALLVDESGARQAKPTMIDWCVFVRVLSVLCARAQRWGVPVRHTVSPTAVHWVSN